MVDVDGHCFAVVRGIGGVAACAVDIGDVEVAGTGGFDVDVNVAADVAQLVAAAEGTGDGAAVEVDGYVAGDGGVDSGDAVAGVGDTAFGAAEDVGVGAAIDVEGYIAVGGGHVRAAVDFLNFVGATLDGQRAAAAGGVVGAAEELANDVGAGNAVGGVVVDADVDVAYGSVEVGAAEDRVDKACMDFGEGGADDIGCAAVAVAAAEDTADAAAVDDGVVVLRGGHVAAAEDIPDGVLVAVVDMDKGGAGGLVVRLVGCHVAAAVDGGQGIGL